MGGDEASICTAFTRRSPARRASKYFELWAPIPAPQAPNKNSGANATSHPPRDNRIPSREMNGMRSTHRPNAHRDDALETRGEKYAVDADKSSVLNRSSRDFPSVSSSSKWRK